MGYEQYVKAELLVLIPVLYVIGIGLKKTQLISDRLIPIAIGIAGVVLSIIYVLAISDLGSPQAIGLAIFTALTQGVLVAGASVFANQNYKQLKSDKTE